MVEIILGASISLISTVIVLLLKNAIEQKRETKNWFFEHYITNSLDRIISASTIYSYIISLKIKFISDKSLFHNDLNFDELIRISSLLNCRSIHVLFNSFYIAVDQFKPDDYHALSDEIKIYISKLEELRIALIELEIKKKKDIHTITENKTVKKLCTDFENLLDKLIEKHGDLGKAYAT